jgi:hypothetical protein
MITDDDLRAIALKLLTRSRLREVEWKMDYEAMAGGDFLEVHLPKSIIRLMFRSPRTEPDFVLLQLCNEKGNWVAQLKAEEGDEDWKLLRELYDQANRYVTGWDEVLGDVQQALQQPGKIGT